MKTLRFKKVAKIAAIAFTSLALIACSDDDDNNNSTTITLGNLELRVVHAVVDAPEVDVTLNNAVAIMALDYAENAGFATITEGEYDVAIDAIVPGGNVNIPLLDDQALAADSRVTVFATGTVASNITAEVVAESAASPSATQVALSIYHGAAGAPPVDVYVTASGAALPGIPTAGNVSFRDPAVDFGTAVGTVEVTTGELYQVRITLAGTTTVVYDSGAIDLAPFAGQSLIVSAIDAENPTEADASPVKLLAINDSTQVEILDTNTEAGAKVLHASPDAGTAVGAVEVFATPDGAPAVQLIPSFEYLDVAAAADAYALVEATTWDFDVSPDNDSNADIPAANFSLDGAALAAGTDITVIAVGFVGTTPAFDLIASADDNRSLATHAKVKVIHGAAAVGTVDVFVTLSSADVLVADIEAGTAGDATLPSVPFTGDSGYLPLAAETYDIRVLDLASDTVVINVEDVAIAAGSVITAVAVGPDGDDDPAAAGLSLLTN